MGDDLVYHLADILKAGRLAHRELDAKASLDSNDKIDVLQRITAVDIRCDGLFIDRDFLVVENILEYFVKLALNLFSSHLCVSLCGTRRGQLTLIATLPLLWGLERSSSHVEAPSSVSFIFVKP